MSMIIKSEHDVEVATEPIHQRLLARCLELHREDSNRDAFVSAENEKDRVSFQELHDFSVAFCQWLLEKGYKKGDVAMLVVHNNWRFFPVLLGCWRAGLIVSAASPQFTKYELAAQIEDSTAKIVVMDLKTSKTVFQATESNTGIKHFISFSPKVSSNNVIFAGQLFRYRSESIWPPPQIDLKNDLLMLPYSSGTTGKPKGVMVTHLNYSTMMTSMLKKVALDLKAMGLPSNFTLPVALQFLPLYHAMGKSRSCMSIHMGTTQIMMEKVDLRRILELVEENMIPQLSLVPALLLRLCESPLIRKIDLSSLRSITSGSAPLPMSAVQKLNKILPHVRISQGYGMTELVFASHIMSADSPDGSVGKLVPGTEMKVIADDGKLCGPREMGECWIRGPQVMKGYWKRPDLIDDVLDKDGFLKTGDIVWYDENGSTFICDRAKELIKVNGKQVAPAELESVLLEHDRVTDACVFGVADKVRGEVPVACVVAAADVTEAALKSFVNKRLASYKRLKEIQFVSEIPRTPTGKILRREMQRIYAHSQNSKI